MAQTIRERMGRPEYHGQASLQLSLYQQTHAELGKINAHMQQGLEVLRSVTHHLKHWQWQWLQVNPFQMRQSVSAGLEISGQCVNAVLTLVAHRNVIGIEIIEIVNLAHCVANASVE